MKTPIIDAARLVGKLESLGLHGLANSVEKADKIGKEKGQIAMTIILPVSWLLFLIVVWVKL